MINPVLTHMQSSGAETDATEVVRASSSVPSYKNKGYLLHYWEFSPVTTKVTRTEESKKNTHCLREEDDSPNPTPPHPTPPHPTPHKLCSVGCSIVSYGKSDKIKSAHLLAKHQERFLSSAEGFIPFSGALVGGAAMTSSYMS